MECGLGILTKMINSISDIINTKKYKDRDLRKDQKIPCRKWLPFIGAE